MVSSLSEVVSVSQGGDSSTRLPLPYEGKKSWRIQCQSDSDVDSNALVQAILTACLL